MSTAFTILYNGHAWLFPGIIAVEYLNVYTLPLCHRNSNVFLQHGNQTYVTLVFIGLSLEGHFFRELQKSHSIRTGHRLTHRNLLKIICNYFDMYVMVKMPQIVSKKK